MRSSHAYVFRGSRPILTMLYKYASLSLTVPSGDTLLALVRRGLLSGIDSLRRRTPCDGRSHGKHCSLVRQTLAVSDGREAVVASSRVSAAIVLQFLPRRQTSCKRTTLRSRPKDRWSVEGMLLVNAFFSSNR